MNYFKKTEDRMLWWVAMQRSWERFPPAAAHAV